MKAAALVIGVLVLGVGGWKAVGPGGATTDEPTRSDGHFAFFTGTAQELLDAQSALYDMLPPAKQAAVDELRDLLESDDGITADEVDQLQNVLAILDCGPEKTLAALGESITLAGLKPGVEMRVTPIRVTDPAPTQDAPSQDEFSGPREDRRLIAVDLLLENTGTAVYEDWTLNAGAQLVNNEEHVDLGAWAGNDSGVRNSPPCRHILESVTIAAGDRLAGCFVFEMLNQYVPCGFRLRLDSGDGGERGEWKLSRND